MSDVATLNSLIKDVTDLGGSVKNVEVDEDERGLILRVPKADGPFDVTMPEHLHLDLNDFHDERGASAKMPICQSRSAPSGTPISQPCLTTRTALRWPTSGRLLAL
ncbi:MAG: hypothetical protein VXX01_08280 [Pseudomonadota bacterium]|nr:hypothetical protein [Pseudomonadota bacterium]